MKKSLFSIILFSFSIFSFAQNNQEAIIEECLRLGNTIAKFQSYEKELNDIKQKKKKNYYSKGEEPIQMLNYKLRKYIKKEFTDIEWKYFTSSAVDNWASGLENKFSKEMGMESVGGDNKTVSLRYTQSKEAAFKAYDEDKTKLNVNCDVEGAGNQKSKKKSRTKTKSKKKTKNPEKVKKKKE